MDVEYDDMEQDEARDGLQAGPSQGAEDQVPGTKLYANPDYEVPLTPEELAARQKRAQRFARFGMPEAPAAPQFFAPPPAQLESYTQLRPNALYVQSDSVQNMDTSAILRWATTFVRKDQLKGMEWIDDVSGCLVFTDPHAAAAGLHGLLSDPSSLTELGNALGRLEDIYTEPAPADLEVVATPRPAHALEGQTPAWIRFALHDDKKSKNARQESRYYAEHAPPASLGFDDRSHQRPTQEELDAELDAYTAGSEFETRRPDRHGRGGRGRRRASPRGQRDEEMDRLDKYEGRHQTAKARTRGLEDLDAELDAYLGGGSGPSMSTESQGQGGPSGTNQGVELFPSLSGFRSDALKQTPQPPTALSWGAPGPSAPHSLADRLGSQVPVSAPPRQSPSTDLFASSNRPKAADLFGDNRSSSGMRGWAN